MRNNEQFQRQSHWSTDCRPFKIALMPPMNSSTTSTYCYSNHLTAKLLFWATASSVSCHPTCVQTASVSHVHVCMCGKLANALSMHYQPGSTVMKSSLAGVPLKNRFSAVTDTVRFSHAGRLGASTVLVGWSTVALNNTAKMLLLTSTKYPKGRYSTGSIGAFSKKDIQEMLAVTGIVPSGVMATDRPSGGSAV